MSRYVVHSRFLSAVLALAVSTLSPAGLLAQGPCETGLPISFGTLRAAQWTAAPLCVTLDLPAAGLLMVEASTVASDDAEPVIEVLACGGEPRVLDRWVASWLVESPEVGRFAVCVMAPDPSRSLGEIKLTVAFAGQLLAKTGDPDEDEVEPDPTLPPPPPPTFSDPNSSPAAKSAAPNVAPAWCAGLLEDDHADVFRCATPLQPGEVVDAEIRNAWGDDSDLFVVRLERHASLHLTVDGENAVVVSLHDRHGDRLRTPPAAREFVEALVPGLYYVRVSAPAGFEGAYRLDAAVVPR